MITYISRKKKQFHPGIFVIHLIPTFFANHSNVFYFKIINAATIKNTSEIILQNNF